MKILAKKIVLIIASIMLCLTILPINTYALNSYSTSAVVADDIKGKKEMDEIFKNLKRIRENAKVIDINIKTIEGKAKSLSEQLGSYIREVRGVSNILNRYKSTYKDSPADIFVANQMQIITSIYDTLMQEELILIDKLVKGDSSASKLVYSDYLNPIYYYSVLGDQMLDYMETTYNLGK
jgi:hypothetical protein